MAVRLDQVAHILSLMFYKRLCEGEASDFLAQLSLQ